MSKAKRKAAEVLIDAVLTSDQSKLESLLGDGFDPNATDDRGATALMVAAGNGKLGLVKSLLSNQADVNVQDFQGLWPLGGRTALMFAASDGHVEIVKLLIAKGANVDAQDSDGETALMKSAFNGHVAIAEFLLSVGASLVLQNSTGDTALDLAESIGQANIAELLKRKSNLSASSPR